MTTLRLGIGLGMLALAGCGLESWFGNVSHAPFERPASKIRGATSWDARYPSQISVVDGDGNAVAPFQSTFPPGVYELRLPSGKYGMLRVQARVGELSLRSLLPSLGEESSADGVNLDARAMTEVLIVEARLSADRQRLKQVTPSAYLGTRPLIRQAFDQAGPTQDLLRMVERLVGLALLDTSGGDPAFFAQPVLDPGATPSDPFSVRTSPLDAGWVRRNFPDIDGDGNAESSSAKFDAKLAEVAKLYRPAGCPDDQRIRLAFTVDFTQGALNGNGGNIDRFKWAKDAPGKRMFFVGWTYTRPGIKSSDIVDPAVDAVLGNSTPNTIPMYDDGTNGDEVSGDGIWTVAFDVPRGAPPATVLRLGYKYTWGTFGAPWTGSEEWPGNARILEVVDENGDDIVYRRDVFGDEATNKDYQNLSLSPKNTGNIDWTTDLRGCGPESHEQKVTLHNAQTCDAWLVPQAVGPVTKACSP